MNDDELSWARGVLTSGMGKSKVGALADGVLDEACAACLVTAANKAASYELAKAGRMPSQEVLRRPVLERAITVLHSLMMDCNLIPMRHQCALLDGEVQVLMGPLGFAGPTAEAASLDGAALGATAAMEATPEQASLF